MSNYVYRVVESDTYYWSVANLRWEVGTQPGGGGGGGDASAANQLLGNASLASIDGKLGTLGQKAMAGSAPVVIASDQTAVPVADGGGSLTVDGTVAASNLPTTVDTNSGAKSASTLRVVLATDQPQLTAKLLVTPDSVALPANQSVNVAQINAVTPLMGAGATGTGSQRVTLATDGQGQVADNAGFTDGATRLDMSGHIFDESAGTALTENDAAASRIDSKRAQVMVVEDATTRGQRQVVTATGAASVNLARILDVALSVGAGSTGTGVQRVAEASCATGSQTSVVGTITANTTILAANTARRGASVFNDSTAVLTLALGGTQSATVFAVKLASQQYFEVPAGYNGAITGSWATATGSARVMEYT